MLQTSHRADAATTLGTLLDTADARIRNSEVFDGMEALLVGLTSVRQSTCSFGEWRTLAERQVRRHPVFATVHQAPFTRRAFDKPRGYPGDAVTLDYIYGLERPASAPDLVRHLYAWEFQTPSCRSVRARKTLLAEQIDAAGSRTQRPRILSLACGHLREATGSHAAPRSRRRRVLRRGPGCGDPGDRCRRVQRVRRGCCPWIRPWRAGEEGGLHESRPRVCGRTLRLSRRAAGGAAHGPAVRDAAGAAAAFSFRTSTRRCATSAISKHSWTGGCCIAMTTT